MNNKREVSKTRLAYKSDSSEATGTCYNLMSRNSDRREKLVKFSNKAAVYAPLHFEHALSVIVKTHLDNLEVVKNGSKSTFEKCSHFIINDYGTSRE